MMTQVNVLWIGDVTSCVVMLQIATAPECRLQKFKLGDEFETVETV